MEVTNLFVLKARTAIEGVTDKKSPISFELIEAAKKLDTIAQDFYKKRDELIRSEAVRKEDGSFVSKSGAEIPKDFSDIEFKNELRFSEELSKLSSQLVDWTPNKPVSLGEMITRKEGDSVPLRDILTDIFTPEELSYFINLKIIE